MIKLSSKRDSTAYVVDHGRRNWVGKIFRRKSETSPIRRGCPENTRFLQSSCQKTWSRRARYGNSDTIWSWTPKKYYFPS